MRDDKTQFFKELWIRSLVPQPRPTFVFFLKFGLEEGEGGGRTASIKNLVESTQ